MIEINGPSYRRLENCENSDDENENENYSGTSRLRRVSAASSSLKRAKRVQRVFVFLFVIIVFLVLYIPLSQNIYRPRVITIPGWSFNTSRETRDYILPDENTTTLDAINVCNPVDDKKIFLLIVVCSSLNNFDQRQTIRETWGNTSEFNYPYFERFHAKAAGRYLPINNKFWKNYSIPLIKDDKGSSSSQNLNETNFLVRVVFLVGQSNSDLSDDLQNKINYESEVNGDLIQENFVDSYNNLTLKSILMLKWVKNNCLDKVKYVMKCDDDSFINIPNLLHVLNGGTIPVYKSTISFYDKNTINAKTVKNRLIDNKNLLLGFLFCDAKPIVDPQSKWFSPNYMFGGEYYPNYLSGTAYVIGIDAVTKLFKKSLSTPLFHLEDVYITGIVASQVKLKRYHHPLFFYSTTKDHCALRGMISQHQFTSTDLQVAYNFITNLSISCAITEKNFLTTKLKLMQRKRCM